MIRLGAVLAILACTSSGGERDLAMTALKAFASGDYSGDPDRWVRASFSEKRKAELARSDSYAGDRYDCNASAFVVVSRYRVVQMVRDGAQWRGTLEFCRVGSSDAQLAALRVEQPSLEQFDVTVQSEGSMRYVLDPPVPRVSVEAVRECIATFLARASGPIYERHASRSKAERDLRARNVLALEVVQRMNASSGACEIQGQGPTAPPGVPKLRPMEVEKN